MTTLQCHTSFRFFRGPFSQLSDDAQPGLPGYTGAHGHTHTHELTNKRWTTPAHPPPSNPGRSQKQFQRRSMSRLNMYLIKYVFTGRPKRKKRRRKKCDQIARALAASRTAYREAQARPDQIDEKKRSLGDFLAPFQPAGPQAPNNRKRKKD